MPDTSDHEERRHRQPGRRDADAVAFRDSATYETVVDEFADVAKEIKRIGWTWKRLAAFAAVVGAVGGGVNLLGGKFLWPSEVIAEQQKATTEAIQSATSRVSAIETRVGNVEEAMDLMSYLLCVQIRRTDPAAVPPKCNDSSIRNLAPR